MPKRPEKQNGSQPCVARAEFALWISADDLEAAVGGDFD
jgi:hypothetical protein